MYLLLHRARARKPSETTTRPRREHFQQRSTGVTPTWGVERVPLTTANASTYGSAWQRGVSYGRFPERATRWTSLQLATGRRLKAQSGPFGGWQQPPDLLTEMSHRSRD